MACEAELARDRRRCRRGCASSTRMTSSTTRAAISATVCAQRRLGVVGRHHDADALSDDHDGFLAPPGRRSIAQGGGGPRAGGRAFGHGGPRRRAHLTPPVRAASVRARWPAAFTRTRASRSCSGRATTSPARSSTSCAARRAASPGPAPSPLRSGWSGTTPPPTTARRRRDGSPPPSRRSSARCTAAARAASSGSRAARGGCSTSAAAAGSSSTRSAAAAGSVQGTELDDRSAAHAREVLGIPVHTGPADAWPWPDGHFDAVVFWHVLEHLAEPQRALERARRLLRPGGVLMVGVPNFASPEARLAAAGWFHLDVPRHVVHLSARWLEGALDAAGFDVRRRSFLTPEYDAFSLVQSAENRLGLRHNLLYDVLRGRAAKLARRRAARAGALGAGARGAARNPRGARDRAPRPRRPGLVGHAARREACLRRATAARRYGVQGSMRRPRGAGLHRVALGLAALGRVAGAARVEEARLGVHEERLIALLRVARAGLLRVDVDRLRVARDGAGLGVHAARLLRLRALAGRRLLRRLRRRRALRFRGGLRPGSTVRARRRREARGREQDCEGEGRAELHRFSPVAVAVRL